MKAQTARQNARSIITALRANADSLKIAASFAIALALMSHLTLVLLLALCLYAAILVKRSTVALIKVVGFVALIVLFIWIAPIILPAIVIIAIVRYMESI